MTATTAPRGGAVNGGRIALIALLVVVAFGAAFAIGKATASGGEETGNPVKPLNQTASPQEVPSISAPTALPKLQSAPEPPDSGGSAPAPGGGSTPAPAPAPTPAPAPAPAPPSGGGGGSGGGPIIEG